MMLAAATVCSAQQKFPQRAGEWEATVSLAGSTDKTTLLYCLNDELWTKALTQNPSCTVSQLSVTLRGASYSMACNMKTVQMATKVEMTFDGMEHMTAKGSGEMTINGKTTATSSLADYRWKGPTCDANRDMNLKFQNKAR